MTPAIAPLVTLHGFTGTPLSWQQVTDPVADQLGAIHHLALLGHSSDVPMTPGVGFADEADRVAAEIERCSGDGVVLAGYSLGARVALVTALRHPRQVRRLVLVGGRPGLSEAEARRQRREADGQWIRLLEQEGIAAFVEQWEALPLWESQRLLPDEVRQAQHRERRNHDPLGLAASLRVLGLAEMPDCWLALGSLEMPVDLIVGELDVTFQRIAEKMADQLPRGRVRVVAGSGHNVLLERPRDLAGILIEVTAVREAGRL